MDNYNFGCRRTEGARNAPLRFNIVNCCEKIHGYTLPELLIVIAIMAVLLVIAVPSYRFLIAENRETAVTNQLISAINFTRSEAVKHRGIVTLCSSADDKICGGQWQQGWIVFVDHQRTGQIDPTQDEILRVFPPLPSGSALEWSGQRSNSYLQMNPNGGTNGQAGTFTYYPHAENQKTFRQVIVSQTGRVRVDVSQ